MVGWVGPQLVFAFPVNQPRHFLRAQAGDGAPLMFPLGFVFPAHPPCCQLWLGGMGGPVGDKPCALSLVCCATSGAL